ncbi:MAG: hypothetical protein GY940_36575, partial [bacterium]|nr:hypothetical protein [bacterium]
MMYDMLGFKSSFILAPSMADLTLFGSAETFRLMVMGVSLVLLGWFSYYFLTVPVHKIPFDRRIGTSIYSSSYDRANEFTAALSGWSFRRMIHKGYDGGKRNSLVSRARLMQPALFSPRLAFVTHGLTSALLYFVAAGVAAYFFLKMEPLMERNTPGQVVPL